MCVCVGRLLVDLAAVSARHIAVRQARACSIDISILYYTILYYTLLYSTILYYTILYHYSTITLLYYTILYYYSTLLYSTLLYSTLLYYTVLYYTILYCRLARADQGALRQGAGLADVAPNNNTYNDKYKQNNNDNTSSTAPNLPT